MAVLEPSDTPRNIIRVLLIYAVLALLFLLNLARIPLLGNGIISPAFLLIGIYYWTITKPHLLPVPIIFCVALAFDLISGSVTGLHAFAFMLIVMIVRSQRRYLLGQSWPVLWFGYGAAAFMLGLVQFAVYSFQAGALLSFWVLMANTLVSFVAYPVITPFLGWLNRFLTVAKSDYT